MSRLRKPRSMHVNKPTLHFVFATHEGDRTAKVLRPVLAKAKRSQQRLRFLGLELTGIKASERRKSEERLVGGLDTIHSMHMRQLAHAYGLPVRLVEAARSRQYKKIAGLPRFPKGFPSYIYEMGFRTAIAYHTDYFYRRFNQSMARHDEVLRNLRKEIESMASNETGVVVYGPYHKGLDRFIASKLGVKTRRTSEKQPYYSIEKEVMEKCLSNPTGRKPSRDELAQIALEKLLGIDFIGFLYEGKMLKRNPLKEMKTLFSNLNAMKRLIKTLSPEQIEARWDFIRNHELTRLPTADKKRQRIAEITRMVQSAFSS